jgi:hypothetical protein
MTGVQYVQSEWRQVEIQPSAAAECCEADAQPQAVQGRRDASEAGGFRGFWAEAGGGMSTPSLGLPISTATPGRLKNKRVLLLDTSATMRDRRAESMRKLGMEVDCAADVSEARSWWRADLYTLVLIDMESGLGHRDRFCDDMRRATPPQQISFLVGKPGYLADVPKADGVPLAEKSNGDQSVRDDVRAALAAVLPGGLSQRWGILEASRRISAVRTLSHARSKASQEKPAPVREFETRELKRMAAESKNLELRALETQTSEPYSEPYSEPQALEHRTLDDLLREELQ